MQQLQHPTRCGPQRGLGRAGRQPRPFSGVVRSSAHQQPSAERQPAQRQELSRRDTLLSLLGLPLAAAQLVSGVAPASAFSAPPPGYRLVVDKLDGYRFLSPENWLAVTSSGNDIFLRNPRNVEQNLFIDMTSPSSSRFKSVEDLGSPEDAAARLLDQFLTKEFMSTRIGIARYGEIVSATTREVDGQTYYDVAIRMTSYGSRNAYAATRQEVLKDYALEWDRTLSAVLGVANNRLYTLRLQTNTELYQKEQPTLRAIMDSFRCQEVETA
ncbi:PsbP domain-containing protein 1, chloroplastic [Tetrabaena socialis]|uniref:PsbP domain-containing protein 1, chloroplastic n=1 Tax=Tetrabaena socialis TaxID=47790 RepID=A0A2J8AEU5_9CHLO|nr:PsbP domain-containing protein 1, chloroplastic [Tetrabaena socialis]|eukprot:PNH11038.1 PsbP domain-containing protein 1, chloroplastic [Tetrabaena socialis]